MSNIFTVTQTHFGNVLTAREIMGDEVKIAFAEYVPHEIHMHQNKSRASIALYAAMSLTEDDRKASGHKYDTVTLRVHLDADYVSTGRNQKQRRLAEVRRVIGDVEVGSPASDIKRNDIFLLVMKAVTEWAQRIVDRANAEVSERALSRAKNAAKNVSGDFTAEEAELAELDRQINELRKRRAAIHDAMHAKALTAFTKYIEETPALAGIVNVADIAAVKRESNFDFLI